MKQKKLLMILALLCAVVQGVWADKWDGSSESRPGYTYQGRIIIYSAAELAYIRNHWEEKSASNTGYRYYYEIDYKLEVDLDMTAATWTPIKGEDYKGTFYGQGHTVKIKINNSSISSNNQGLFGTIADGGGVKDLHLDCYIKVGNARYVGGICGENNGTIENCWVDGHIESNHYSEYDADLGGIAGLNNNDGAIKYCCVTADVKNTNKNSGVGGIAGSNEGSIEHVTFTGSVSVEHAQDNKYVGDQDGKLENNYDSYNESEYNAASGNDLYRLAIKYPVLPNPFVINSTDDWNIFNDYVTHACSFRGRTVRLDSDISISTMIGSTNESDVFSGTFDGNGHTITASIDYQMTPEFKNTYFIAPFRHINGATIKNLKMAGKVYGGESTGTIVALAKGTGNRIENCISTADVVGIQQIGGIVGHASDCDIDISGCVYSSLLHSIYINKGAMIGWADKGGTKNITNCLYVMYDKQDHYLLDMAKGDNKYIFTNCYKTTSTGDYGTLATAASQIGVGALVKDYGMVKAYEHGIWYDGRYYVDNSVAMPGVGTEADPIRIGSTAHWDRLADAVNGGDTFSGQYLKLTNDISVTTMAGVDDGISFQGTFDGNGKKISFNNGSSESPFNENYCAPFRHVKNATIKNLHVDGTIYTSAMKAAGVVGESHGALTITGCRSSVAINSSKSGDGTHGGFVATLSGANNTIIIDGCVFDGSFATTNGTNGCGGFVGWGVYNKPVIRNSLMKPTSVAASMVERTFARWYTGYEPTIEGCYFVATKNLPTDQGIKSVILNAAPASLGNLVKNYGVLKAYESGLFYSGRYYMDASTLTLIDDADNNSIISSFNGLTVDATLKGRTFYKDGMWNTICLPFDVVLEGSPLEGAVARPLSAASVDGKALNLTFGDAVTELKAGTPYIIKWESGYDIENPVFTGVTIDKTARSYDNGASGDERVRFVGIYRNRTFKDTQNTILLMGKDNNLYYPIKGASIGSQRAYFRIGNKGAALARFDSFNIGYGDSETTGIEPIHNSQFTIDNSWYSLDGRKLQGKPTTKGVYINNGVKIVIK